MNAKNGILLAMVAAASVSSAHAQNFLFNPSFELPAVPNGSFVAFTAGQTIARDGLWIRPSLPPT